MMDCLLCLICRGIIIIKKLCIYPCRCPQEQFPLQIFPTLLSAHAQQQSRKPLHVMVKPLNNNIYNIFPHYNVIKNHWNSFKLLFWELKQHTIKNLHCYFYSSHSFLHFLASTIKQNFKMLSYSHVKQKE